MKGDVPPTIVTDAVPLHWLQVVAVEAVLELNELQERMAREAPSLIPPNTTLNEEEEQLLLTLDVALT